MCRSCFLVAAVLVLGPAFLAAQDDNRYVSRVTFSGIKAMAMSLHPESKQVVEGYSNGTMSTLVLATKKVVAIEGFPAHGNMAVTAIVFSPDGKWVASAGQDGKVDLWETATIARFQEDCQERKEGDAMPLSPRPKGTIVAHKNGVNALSFSPDGTRLATCGGDGMVRIWSVESGKALLVIMAHRGNVHALAFSPDGELLASGGADKTAKLWQSTANKLVHTLARHEGPVLAVAFSPDGKQLATASGVPKKSGQILVWNTATGKEDYQIGKLDDMVTTLSFHPKLPRLASGGLDKKIRVWNTETKKQIYIDEHAGPLIRVHFTADGNLLGSVCPEEIKWWLGSPKVLK